jgi:hypothetical protein
MLPLFSDKFISHLGKRLGGMLPRRRLGKRSREAKGEPV